MVLMGLLVVLLVVLLETSEGKFALSLFAVRLARFEAPISMPVCILMR